MGNSQHKCALSDQVDLSHFKLLRSIGRGSFGKVRIVEHRVTKKQYALKYFSKEDLVRRKMAKNIVRERNILVGLTHPFVCNLRFAFQDDFNLYMTLDLMMGGDLRFHFQRRRFSQEELIFIAAEIASALCYIHSLGVVHRDIKPDNILLDDKGHAHLTDFNIATYTSPDTPLQSQSGTMQYMAPEIIEGKAYDHCIDWWSLGVTLYEGIYGKTPFHDALKTSKRKDAIVSESISWIFNSKINADAPIIQLTKKLLEKDPANRLGHHGGFFSIQKCPAFSAIDWDLMVKKLVMPPFCPSGTKPNFDMSYDLEELLLEDSPLESLPSRRTRKPRKLSPEMIYLENSYNTYDFYGTVMGRRHSVDYTAEALPTPQQMQVTPDTKENQLTPANIKSLRRVSRSMADLTQASYELNLGVPITPQQSFLTPCASSTHSTLSTESLSGQSTPVPSSTSVSVDKNSDKRSPLVSSILRPLHKKFNYSKRSIDLNTLSPTTVVSPSLRNIATTGGPSMLAIRSLSSPATTNSRVTSS